MATTNAAEAQGTAAVDQDSSRAIAPAPKKGGILLVVPPFQTTFTPSLGVSQLKANLQTASFDTEVLYLNLQFAELIGPNEYETIVSWASTLFGDYLFSRVLYGVNDADLEAYAQESFLQDVAQKLLTMFPEKSLVEVMHRLINAASEWVDISTRIILEREPTMVGFTTMFQQNCSSLAVMAKIKELRPDLVTAIGGSSCEGEMGLELFARFPQIDYLGRGECDGAIVTLAEALKRDGVAKAIPGILSRGDTAESPSSKPLQDEDLEALPYPDFDDYFAQLSISSLGDKIAPALVMETSRGCWWGAKQHCTFCGLNANGMAFRSKSGPRALKEMESLARKYGVRQIQVVDNILDMDYFKSVIPKLIENPVADLYYETKANLTREQVHMLADSGIRWIQPGIESLSDSTLKLMGKGVTELQNLQLLKWCMEAGVSVDWNLLYGFPGEDETELDIVAKHSESLCHLEPPTSAIVLNLDRFSPYFSAPEKYGLDPTYPAKQYRYVYPFPDEALKRIAYFYDSDFFKGKGGSPGFKTLKAVVKTWAKNYAHSHLVAIPRRNCLLILDTRPARRRFMHKLAGLQREVYESCDKSTGLNTMMRSMPEGTLREQVEAALQSLAADKLILAVNGKYLALATEQLDCHKRLTKNRPMGRFKPSSIGVFAQRIGKLRNPVAIFNAAAKTFTRIGKNSMTKLRWKAVFLVVRTLAQPRLDKSPTLIPLRSAD